MRRFVLVTALGTLSAFWSCGGESSRVGGETHWLGDCETDAECADGQCLCGICSRTCSGDTDCAGPRKAACFATASPGLASRCSSAVKKASTGVCLATCNHDSECLWGTECHLGACVAGNREGGVPGSDASGREGGNGIGDDAALRDAASKVNGPDAAGFVHIDAGTTFGDPVEVPEPRATIDGPADILIGHWAQPQTNCTESQTTSPCIHLEITNGPGGSGIVGVTYLSTLPPTTFMPPPFAPVTDPNKGYPVELGPEEYGSYNSKLEYSYPGVRERVLDGIFDGKTLTYWYSHDDLYTDWCKLQTPYPFELHGVQSYRCVPKDASPANTDFGKFVLCTSEWDFGNCAGSLGDVVPCACMDGADGQIGVEKPLCSPAACRCTAPGCAADLRNSTVRVKYTLDGTSLRNEQGYAELQRVSQ